MKVIIHNVIGSNGHVIPLGIDMDKKHAQASVFDEDIILCGSGTILKGRFAPDKGSSHHLPLPDDDDMRPSLAVIDSMARINCWRSMSESGHWKEFYALTSSFTNRAYVSNLIRIGVQPILSGEEKVDLAKAIDVLGKDFGHRVCRVESRGVLNNILLERNLVDVLSMIMYPAKPGNGNVSDAVMIWTKGFRLAQERRLGQGARWLLYERK
jgi:2,5-diamino-6-(ribosylamino)-4(3H)-pyrimidinone 5'-phosphate reductase